jgi:osmotically-inducible protein OsmY
LNELDVRLNENARRHDDQLRADILQALMLNSSVPSTVDVRVDQGFVTLVGTAERQHERDEARSESRRRSSGRSTCSTAST